MKQKLFFAMVMASLLLLSACGGTPFRRLYTLCNQSGKDIVLYPSGMNDSVELAPNEVYIKDIITYGEYVKVDAYPVSDSVLYIIMDGVKYMVDRNQEGNCLLPYSYEPAPEAYADSIKQQPSDQVLVFYLTEEYIKKQIVVEKE